MSDDKKSRTMTPKGFLHKTTTRAANSAGAFLAQYREYLTTGELAPIMTPIIRQVDEKLLMPTPALKLVQAAVMGHIIATDQAKAEEAIERANEPKAVKTWVACIKDAEGNVCTRMTNDGEEDLLKSFEHPQEADRWVDRRLFDGAPDWYGEVEGLGTHVYVERADAIARVLKQPKGPAIHKKAVTTKTLGFGVKAHQTRASFSRG